MSARIRSHVVTSIDPLRIAIGCRDELVAEKLINAARIDFGIPPGEEDEDVNSYREIVQEYFNATLPLECEPSGWIHVLKRLVDVFGIRVRKSALAIEDDWHWDAVTEYERVASQYIDAKVAKLLACLANGRPLLAKTMDYGDGGYYAWFDPSELALLYDSLVVLDADIFSKSDWLGDFHSALLDSIKGCRKHSLIIGAS